ncbi:ATPase, F0 complex, subunit J [Auricularia subglabra TFB-10046 SS5]|nr:ATPase, F0 complex, subunit J [Auricularia subglabra TFB-10046 SS5]
MSLFGPRRFPVPIVKPLYPFFVAGAVTFLLVGKLQNLMLNSAEFANDPRNPYAAQNARKNEH